MDSLWIQFFVANSLFIHYHFRDITMNPPSLSRIIYKLTIILANSLWIYYEFTIFLANTPWIHHLFRKHTISSLFVNLLWINFFWPIEYASTICFLKSLLIYYLCRKFNEFGSDSAKCKIADNVWSNSYLSTFFQIFSSYCFYILGSSLMNLFGPKNDLFWPL